MSASISSEFPFKSNYVEVKGSQIHYVDEGQGDPILFLHGNPTSSYLWRNIIPHLTSHARCIAPDLIGMGQSDKPDIEYGFADTYKYLEAFIGKMKLQHITLVIHDWGSGLGFRYAHQHAENIKGICFMEAMYKLVEFEKMPKRVQTAMKLMRKPFANWLMIGALNFFVKKMLPNGVVRKLSKEELAFYRVPYPTIKSRKPVRRWPAEVPIEGQPEENARVVASYHEWLKQTNIPKLCLYGDPGMLIPIDEIPWIEQHFPNIQTKYIGKGLHFLQEDQPQAIGEALKNWYTALG